jgi:tRNA(Ile)-lysidine synthase TilS/MesJ
MLEPGDRVAVGLSGGADSLALAALLARLAPTLAPPLELVGLHVCLAAEGRTDGLPEPIHRWCASQGLALVEVPPRLDPAESPPLECFSCARVRRRTLLEAADGRGCRALALGHHADDVVETWLMSLLYTGSAETLAPRRDYFDGAVTVIRPLYEIRREELGRLLRLCGAPEPVRTCGREGAGRRELVQRALSVFGRDQRRVRRQLFWAAVRGLATDHRCGRVGSR